MRPIHQYHEMQQEFMGLNRALRADPRQWRETTNISPREFPGFSPRERRGAMAQLNNPGGILARDALCYVDGATLYINNLPVTGLMLLTGAKHNPKQMVSMGAYIIIMPDKKYVNTADLSDYGSIESEYTYTGNVMLTPARVDGSDIPMEGIIVGVEPPQYPINGDYWIDTTKDIHVLKQYSAESETWTLIPSTYTKIALPGVGAHFEKQDGVEIAGLNFAGTDPNLLKQIPQLNGTKVINAKHDDYIIVTGLLSQVHILTDVTVTVKRTMPPMDLLTESENRLWGCKYGVVDGKTVNELYACALGDFKNWKRYLGVSTDSYAASVGSDGKFTGAITYQGYVLFFKETCIHKVYGNTPAGYRIETYDCRGVQEGSHRSLQIVNELLYYKGRTDVLVYDGSDPVSISEHLGEGTYRQGVAGAYKHSYYLSMKDHEDISHLFLYDTRLRMWFRHDSTDALGFAQVDDDLYCLTASGQLLSLYGKNGAVEGPVAWEAVTGVVGYEQRDHKYITRINIRALIPADGELSVYFRYESVGDWLLAGSITGAGMVRSVMLPIRPRRCDHFEMKLAGAGDVRIFSIAKILEIGSDGRWT